MLSRFKPKIGIQVLNWLRQVVITVHEYLPCLLSFQISGSIVLEFYRLIGFEFLSHTLIRFINCVYGLAWETSNVVNLFWRNWVYQVSFLIIERMEVYFRLNIAYSNVFFLDVQWIVLHCLNLIIRWRVLFLFFFADQSSSCHPLRHCRRRHSQHITGLLDYR